MADTKKNWLIRFCIFSINMYKKWISPFLPAACRFYPTCSEYCAKSIEKHGLIFGSSLAVRRLFKCHPFHPGGFDPVP